MTTMKAAGWARVKVNWCGICGSDLHELVHNKDRNVKIIVQPAAPAVAAE